MPPSGVLKTDLYQPVAEELARAERVFDDELRSDLPFVNEFCQRVERYRGKMLRPSLLLLTARACGRLKNAHVTLAAVLEMVHVATLVHDDVLDAAEVRRKQPTISATDGNETAVMLGDFLISHAFHLCSSLGDAYASRVIGATTNTVCEGELLQIRHRGDVGLTEEQYLDIIRRKTGALTGVCCGLGAHYAGADPDQATAWRAFGEDLGMAFQIVDDVLDCVGDPGEMGKTLGRDLDLGEPTLPTLHALHHGSARVRRELARVLSNGHTASRSTVRDWLEQAGSLDYAYGHALGFVEAAQAHLRTVPDTPARDSLMAITDFVVRRRR